MQIVFLGDQLPTLKVLEQIFSGDPYEVKGMWIQTANPIACTGMEPKKWHKAIKKLDFTVCVDLFMTPTAMLCDVILPAATFLEKDSLRAWWVPLNPTGTTGTPALMASMIAPVLKGCR